MKSKFNITDRSSRNVVILSVQISNQFNRYQINLRAKPNYPIDTFTIQTTTFEIIDLDFQLEIKKTFLVTYNMNEIIFVNMK